MWYHRRLHRNPWLTPLGSIVVVHPWLPSAISALQIRPHPPRVLSVGQLDVFPRINTAFVTWLGACYQGPIGRFRSPDRLLYPRFVHGKTPIGNRCSCYFYWGFSSSNAAIVLYGGCTRSMADAAVVLYNRTRRIRSALQERDLDLV